MAVTGSLRDMSLVNLITLNCNERNQARLILRDREREAIVFFADGQIVHASLDSLQGEEVIYELLAWEEGDFELEQGVESPLHTVTAGWSGMLLKGLGRVDEGKAGLELIWSEGEEQEAQDKGDKLTQRMVRALKMIDGIEEALMCSREGAVLGQDTHDDYTKDAALTAFVGRRTAALGDLLNAGLLKECVLIEKKRNVMIVTHEQNYVCLYLAPRTSTKSMTPIIQMILRRYR